MKQAAPSLFLLDLERGESSRENGEQLRGGVSLQHFSTALFRFLIYSTVFWIPYSFLLSIQGRLHSVEAVKTQLKSQLYQNILGGMKQCIRCTSWPQLQACSHSSYLATLQDGDAALFCSYQQMYVPALEPVEVSSLGTCEIAFLHLTACQRVRYRYSFCWLHTNNLKM